jgi:hypothetical protein
MRRTAAALVCSLALCGCAYQVRQVGDDRFLSTPVGWQPGKTTVRDVILAFGPPDMIRWSAGRLLFVYRAERQAESSFVLAAYLKVFSAQTGRHEDGTLIVAFDDRDLLLYHGESEEPRHDFSGNIGLLSLLSSIF